METTVKQHYVWRHYLKSWCDNKGAFACKRLSTGKQFSTGPMAIMNSKCFYKFEKLSNIEWIIFKYVSLDKTPDFLAEMEKMPYQILSQINDVFNGKGLLLLDEKTINEIMTEFGEKLECGYENAGAPVLDELIKGNLSSFDFDDEDGWLVDLLVFLFSQNFRTKKRRNDMVASMQEAVKEKQLKALSGVNWGNIYNYAFYHLSIVFLILCTSTKGVGLNCTILQIPLLLQAISQFSLMMSIPMTQS